MLCNISEGRTGVCDHYANLQGVLVRLDPLVLTARTGDARGALVRSMASRGTAICWRRDRRAREVRAVHAGPVAHGDQAQGSRQVIYNWIRCYRRNFR